MRARVCLFKRIQSHSAMNIAGNRKRIVSPNTQQNTIQRGTEWKQQNDENQLKAPKTRYSPYIHIHSHHMLETANCLVVVVIVVSSYSACSYVCLQNISTVDSGVVDFWTFRPTWNNYNTHSMFSVAITLLQFPLLPLSSSFSAHVMIISFHCHFFPFRSFSPIHKRRTYIIAHLRGAFNVCVCFHHTFFFTNKINIVSVLICVYIFGR